MKIAMDWIGEYVTPAPGAEAAAEALMNAGLPVESVAAAEGAKGKTHVLDVEVTSNRTDCFCHVGLAREIAALTGGRFRMPAVGVLQEGGAPAGESTDVRVQTGAGCPYYTARLVRGVKVGPSPEWMQRRLGSIGVRPVNNVVDVTNYVLMELGQPLHAFDFDALSGGRIVVRNARVGEKLEAIDGKTYELEPTMLVIADGQKAVAIAGVMGGKATEVTERTVNVLLESARFDPLSVRTTSRTLGLRSESSFRFERGIDPAMADLAGRRAAELMVEVAGGQVAPGVASEGTPGVKVVTVRMRVKRFEAIMGYRIAPERGLAILQALGFAAGLDEEAGGRDLLYSRVPTHRQDVDREIDLIEEIARVEGYGHVPTLDRVSHPVAPESDREKAGRAVRQALVEAGFSEAVTVTFVGEAQGQPFVAGEDGGMSLIHTQHAGWKSEVLRPSLLPSLLGVRRTNQNVGIADARVFETGATFVQVGPGAAQPPTQRQRVAAVAGDVGTLTGLLGVLAEGVNPEMRVWVEPRDHAFFAGGASGEVWMAAGAKKQAIGVVGQFSAEVQKRYDLRHPAAGLEISWEALIEAYAPVRRARALARFPGVTRDLSVVVDEAVRWRDVEAAVAEAKLASLEKAVFVTTFRGKGVEPGKKSLTLTLEFRDPARTLTSEEVDAEVKKAVAVLEERFGASLRT